MEIDFLYFDYCPSWKQGLENLQSVLEEEKIEAEINLIQVESDEDAAKGKFLGSPSFRVNGKDLWPEDRKDYYLGCRVYKTEGGMYGVPTVEMLRNKILIFWPPE